MTITLDAHLLLERADMLQGDALDELADMADTLRHLAQNCHGDHRPDCPILNELSARRLAEARPRAQAPKPARALN